jgi:SAM-dependent methyltransferase
MPNLGWCGNVRFPPIADLCETVCGISKFACLGLCSRQYNRCYSGRRIGMGTAQVQGALWGARAREWTDLQEQAFKPLYEAAFDFVQVRSGTTLLDIGCGAGLALSIAKARGAEAAGIDAAPELVEIARSRCPGSDIRVGELEELPFNEGKFDVVTGFNSFQYAADRVHGLREARRVMTTDGRLAAAVWGSPENCEMGGYLAALGSLMPPPPPGAPGPWALSPPGAVEDLAADAGLRPVDAKSVMTLFSFADENTAIRGLLAAGPAVRAIEASGEDAVASAVLKAIEPYRQSDGSFALRNEFRFIIATRA